MHHIRKLLLNRVYDSRGSKIVAIVALVLSAFIVGAGRGRTGPGVVEATGFKLVDSAGKIRGAWGVGGDEVAFYLYDKNLHKRLSIVIGDNPTIRIYGDNDKVGMQISQHPEDGDHVVLFDQSGVERIALMATQSASSIRLLDSRRATRVRIWTSPDDVASINIDDAGENTIWKMESQGIKRLEQNHK